MVNGFQRDSFLQSLLEVYHAKIVPKKVIRRMGRKTPAPDHIYPFTGLRLRLLPWEQTVRGIPLLKPPCYQGLRSP